VRHLQDTDLTAQETEALKELERRLRASFQIESLILYGSVARGNSDEESDIDLLVITTQALPRSIRHRITDIVFDINLKHDTNFSTLVVDTQSWSSGPFSILPIYTEIMRDGVWI